MEDRKNKVVILNLFQDLHRSFPTRGFTLIELLVVVLIIGILAAVALPQYQVAVKKADLSRYIPLVDAAYKAQQIYHLANGEYTRNLNDLDIDLPIDSSCEAKIENNITYAYDCKKWYVGIHNSISSVEAGTSDIHYIKWLKNFTTGGYTYQKDESYCFAKNNISAKACQAMGGTDIETGSGTWNKRYLLP